MTCSTYIARTERASQATPLHPSVRTPLAGAGNLTGKRILLVLSTLEMGGAERQALALAHYLKNHAHVQIWGLSRAGLAAQQCEELGIAWRLMPFRWPCRKTNLVKNLSRFIFALRHERPDIVIAYAAWANVACGLARPFTGLKAFIWNQRDVSPHFLKPDRITSKASARASAFIANSAAAVDHLVNDFSIPRDAVSIIPNGVNAINGGTEKKHFCNKYGINEHRPLACMLANFREPKDHETALRAWRLLANRKRSGTRMPVLVLAGADGHTLDACRALVSTLAIEDHVRFAGQVVDVPALLRSVDLKVFCSKSESCPNAVLEAMAAGLPVVATDLPAIRELIGDGELSFLLPPSDASALADSVERLMADGDLRERLGQDNRKRAEKTFGMDRMINSTLELLSSLVPSQA